MLVLKVVRGAGLQLCASHVESQSDPPGALEFIDYCDGYQPDGALMVP